MSGEQDRPDGESASPLGAAVGDAGGAAVGVEGGAGVGRGAGGGLDRGAGCGGRAAEETAPGRDDRLALRAGARTSGVAADVACEWEANPAQATHEGDEGSAEATAWSVAGRRSVAADALRRRAQDPGRSRVAALSARQAGPARGAGREAVACPALGGHRPRAAVASRPQVFQARCRLVSASGAPRSEDDGLPLGERCCAARDDHP